MTASQLGASETRGRVSQGKKKIYQDRQKPNKERYALKSDNSSALEKEGTELEDSTCMICSCCINYIQIAEICDSADIKCGKLQQ